MFPHPGEDYIACLADNSTGLAIIQFAHQHLQNLTEEKCSAFCYAEGQDYGGFSAEAHCLCGVALDFNSSSDCLPFCDEPFMASICGPSLVWKVFPAQLPVSLVSSGASDSLPRPVAFDIRLPVVFDVRVLVAHMLQWDFGDQTGSFNTTKTTVRHKYALPGHYNITVVVFVGHRFTAAETEIEVVAPPKKVELQCPQLVKTNESLRLQIRNQGGTSLSGAYSIAAEDQEPPKGGLKPAC